jgi:hypothetical protein
MKTTIIKALDMYFNCNESLHQGCESNKRDCLKGIMENVYNYGAKDYQKIIETKIQKATSWKQFQAQLKDNPFEIR